MKRHVIVLAVFGVLGFFGAGCGPTMDDSAPMGGDPTTEPRPADDVTSEEDREVHQMAKNCQSTCPGVRADGSACSIVGFGATTFLGGCKKACRFAREDAVSKQGPQGCTISSACSDVCS